MRAQKNVALIFCLIFFCFGLGLLFSLPAQAATGATSTWCHDKALALKISCANTSSLTTCKINRGSYVNSCNLKFAFSEAMLMLMTPTKLAQTLDAEAAKFTISNIIIDPATAAPYPCSKLYITTNCLTQSDCVAQKGIWANNKCNLPPGVCYQESHCPDTQYCDEVNVNPLLSNKCVNKSGGGATCTGSDTCLSGQCVNGKCNCLADDDCAANQYCDKTKKLCVSAKFGGEACQTNAVCLAKLCVSGKCACVDDKNCAPNFYCIKATKTCAAKKYGGTACANGVECLSSQCSLGKCFCTKDSHCPSNSVCDSLNSGTCKKAVCGDGFTASPIEECDDSNGINNDGCTNQCKKPYCGDSITQTKSYIPGQDPEECDDGNNSEIDKCNNFCQFTQCGDGLIQTVLGEQCDDSNTTNGDGCSSLCKLECGNGKLDKGETCDDGNQIDTDACTNFCIKPYCGDFIVWKGVEECDDGNDEFKDGCTPSCKLEKAAPIDIENKMDVELKSGFSQIDGIYCCDNPVTCMPPVEDKVNESLYVGKAQQCLKQFGCLKGSCSIQPICGNGKKETGEACDDGNQTNNDGCSALCESEVLTQTDFSSSGKDYCCMGSPISCLKIIPIDDPNLAAKEKACLDKYKCAAGICTTCGDGKKEGAEECDDSNQEDLDNCSNQCKTAKCGDGLQQTKASPPEACDDGNTIDTDACTSKCAVAVCGDGVIWKDKEECDDGNKTAKDGCSDVCKIEAMPPNCGDGNKGKGEECDDGNNANNDGCSAICKNEPDVPGCGDGNFSVKTEECDDGNKINGDGCSASCKNEAPPDACGDGKIMTPEECDDGNKISADGCSDACKLEKSPKGCGDGKVDKKKGEQCDDNNTKSGDGCDMFCQTEAPAGSPATKCSPACSAWQECKADPADATKFKCFFLKDKCDVEADCQDATKTCDAVNHNCLAKKKCTSHAECNPDPLPTQFCDVDKQLCLPLLIAGSSCKSADGAGQNEYCLSNLCLATLKCGCNTNNDCAKNQQCDETKTKTCIDKKAVGEKCDNAKPAECISGNCKDGVCLCNKGSECPDGQYCGSEKSLCVAKLGDAAVCTDKEQCLSGDCVIKAGEKTGNCTKPAAPAPAGTAPKVEDIILPNPINAADPNVLVGRVIEYVIGLTGSLALIMFLYGGATWIFSGGNDKNIQKGKDTLIWAAIGLAFVFSSYIIVKFVMQIIGANI